MAFDMKDSIVFMEDYGIYDVVLPFILVFTLVFAILEKIKIFGKESRRYNAVIALVMALLFVAATHLVEALNKYLPVLGLVLAAFLGLMLMLGIFGVKEGGPGQRLFWIIAGAVAIAIGLTYIPQIGGVLGDIFGSLSEYSGVFIMLVIVAGIIAWAIKGPSEGKSD